MTLAAAVRPFALRADLLDFAAAPAGAGRRRAGPALPARPLAAGGRRGAASPACRPTRRTRRGSASTSGRLLLPGFIDTHVHSPQLDVIASFGTELLDWLARYTFPSSGAWADPAVALPARRIFLDALLAHGTTSAVVFPTVHAGSADALFAAAQQRGMRRHRRQGADGPPRARRTAGHPWTVAQAERDMCRPHPALARPRPLAATR
jgi:guanine deaminase